MRISAAWLFEFIEWKKIIKTPYDISVKLPEDLTLAGIAVERVIPPHLQQTYDLKGSIASHIGIDFIDDPDYLDAIRDSTIFEMEITTNRPDAMNHYGVARECSALYDVSLKPIKPRLPQAHPAPKPFPIEIRDEKGCGR